MSFDSLNKVQRRKVTLFLTCLVIAVLAWLFFALSNRYVYRINTQIRYINPPQNRAFQPLQSDTVSIQLESTGWFMLFSKIPRIAKVLEVNLRSLNDRNFVTFSEQRYSIKTQFGAEQQIISVSPDTLYFDFSSRKLKKVPVRLAYNLTFQPQNDISGQILVSPKYVTVSGPAEDLDKISYWSTDSLIAKNVSTRLLVKKSLTHSVKANISVYPHTVNVLVPIDQFTEKTIEVPLKIINQNGRAAKIFPEKVKVTFLTATSNYAGIDRDSFELVVNLERWRNEGYTQLPVKLVRFPRFCKLVRIEPQTVDFIVEN